MPTIVNSYDEAIEKTASKECRFTMLDGATARFATAGRFCKRLVVTGEAVNPSGASFILPRNSRYKEILTNSTMELRENGRLETLEEFFDRWGSCSNLSTTRLSMSSLRYFFVLAYGSAFVIFLVMVLDPQRPPNRDQLAHPSVEPSAYAPNEVPGYDEDTVYDEGRV